MFRHAYAIFSLGLFPKGSQPAKFYGLPKLHKKRDTYATTS